MSLPQHAIQPEVISSYPQEWLDGFSLGIYQKIPSWHEWHDGVLSVWATSEVSKTEQPVPQPSPPWVPAGPIEQPVFEGPRWSDRVWQQQQWPDNVYGDDPFIDRLTEHQWDKIIARRIHQPDNNPPMMEKGNLLFSYVSCQPVAT